MMLIKRSTSIISLLSKQRSIRSAASIGIRSFASSANELKSRSTSHSSPASELLSKLKSEIASQKELCMEQPEEFDVKTVLKNYDAFLKENKWIVEHAENSTLVTLKRRDEELQADITIKFDLMQVFNELSAETESDFEEYNEQEADEIESSQENDENDHDISADVDEDYDFVTLPFSLEIKRDSISDKTLLFDCVLEGTEDQNEIVIENASIIPTADSAASKSVYLAPVYNQLDEELQDSFGEFVKNLVESEELMGFMTNYTIASEASMYQKWMKDISSILKH